VLAPNTEALDRTKKLTVYAREGVVNVWLPFADIELDLAGIWA
jgi:hypothetical protein